MKILVTGACGQLGSDVVKQALKRGYEIVATDINNSLSYDNFVQLDITNEQDVMNAVESIEPNAIIHCAGWTAVDAAEDIDNIRKVNMINHLGSLYLAKATRAIDAKMLYISTDYVFNGEGEKPWAADCKNFGPLSVYGKSKLDGEFSVSSVLSKFFIVRISWVFGFNGNNFVKTMIKLSKKYNEIKVVNDQIGTPTYTYDLARLLIDMIETEEYGFYHATNEGGFISWYDFAKEIFKVANIDVNVIPVSTKEYGASKAQRPMNSRLDKKKLIEKGFEPLADWKDALKRYLKEIDKEEL